MECPKCGNELTKKHQAIPNDVCYLYICTDPSCPIIKVEVTVYK